MSIVETAHFEGPEKKLKVTFAKDAPGLRSLPRPVWDQVLGAAGAAIVSAAHDEYWDAYVLSESSLFVSDHSLTLITCGQTRLVDAVAPLLSHAPRAALSQLLYARKSEHFPQHQASTFDADAKRLRALRGPSGPCAQRRLGEGEHFVDLFDSAASGHARRPDVTREVLMYGPSSTACPRFARSQASRAAFCDPSCPAQRKARADRARARSAPAGAGPSPGTDDDRRQVTSPAVSARRQRAGRRRANEKRPGLVVPDSPNGP